LNTNLTTEEQEELAKTNYPEFLKLADYWRKTDELYYNMFIAPLMEKYKTSQQTSAFEYRATPKTARPMLIFMIAGFVLVMGIAGVVFMLNSHTGSDKSELYNVRYEVTGTAESVLITYADEKGKLIQISDIALPWKKIISLEKYGNLTLIAQNQNVTGDMTVRIYIDGKLFKESSSSEPHGIANVTGIVK
jgi:hypothetical protein